MKAQRVLSKRLKIGILASAVLVCVFIGSTIAWYQDSEIRVNTFTLGQLEVQISELDGGQYVATQSLKFLNYEQKKITNDLLIEPGAAFMLQDFYISNIGDVPLKYKLRLFSEDEDQQLMDALEFTVKADGRDVDLDNYEESLDPSENSGPIRICMKMKEDAGNAFQGKCLEKLTVEVYAYQDGMSPEEISDFIEGNLQ